MHSVIESENDKSLSVDEMEDEFMCFDNQDQPDDSEALQPLSSYHLE